jgi:hypothetical protein
MKQRAITEVHEACLVPYRLTSSGVEFCLVSEIGANRWEFPKAELGAEDAPVAEPLSRAAQTTGLWGEMLEAEPLGDFRATRGCQVRAMTGYLMRVTTASDAWPRQSTHRRLWCLAEEARVRIRRKPLRRFIDLALRQADSQLAANGSGRSDTRARAS